MRRLRPAPMVSWTTFGQLLDQWFEECERMDLSPTTIRKNRAQIERTTRPNLGPTRCFHLLRNPVPQ
jgi:Phage integrase, N-terminal SAM-like domain